MKLTHLYQKRTALLAHESISNQKLVDRVAMTPPDESLLWTGRSTCALPGFGTGPQEVGLPGNVLYSGPSGPSRPLGRRSALRVPGPIREPGPAKAVTLSAATMWPHSEQAIRA